MTVSHEDIAVGGCHDGARPIKCVFGQTRDAGFAKPHHDFSVGAELNYLLAFAVGAAGVRYPDETFLVDPEAMRVDEQAGAKVLQHLAAGIEFENRGEVGASAGTWPGGASIGDPDVAVGADTDRADDAEFPARRQLGPVGSFAVEIGLGIRRLSFAIDIFDAAYQFIESIYGLLPR